MTHPLLNGISFPDDASIHAEPHPGHACFHVGGTFTRLSRDNAHKLRQWLTDWLGDEQPTPLSYDENVTKLVKVATLTLNNCISEGEYPTTYHLLRNALAPFLPPPDPDAGLVEKMVKKAGNLPAADHYQGPLSLRVATDNMRQLLAVVREHDKEQAK